MVSIALAAHIRSNLQQIIAQWISTPFGKQKLNLNVVFLRGLFCIIKCWLLTTFRRDIGSVTQFAVFLTISSTKNRSEDRRIFSEIAYYRALLDSSTNHTATRMSSFLSRQNSSPISIIYSAPRYWKDNLCINELPSLALSYKDSKLSCTANVSSTGCQQSALYYVKESTQKNGNSFRQRLPFQ